MALVARLTNVQRSVGARAILRGINFEVNTGELVALVGPSGCGKTTLLTLLGGLDADFSGDITLFDQALRDLSDDARSGLRAQRIGFVFQAFHLLEHLSVRENVELPLWLAPGADPGRIHASALEALKVVGLEQRASDSVRPLSGGERQRVAIARALVNKPGLLLADEPTGNLDRETGAKILDLFQTIAAQNCAVVVATHDPATAARAQRVLTLHDGVLESRS